MSSNRDDDTFTDLAEEEQRRQKRRSSGGPILRFFLAIGAVVVVVILAGLFVRDWLGEREAQAYEEYMGQVSETLKSSDAMGTELSQLLVQPGDSTRKDVQGRLDRYIQKSEQLTEQAREQEAPEDLMEAHKWFVATMQLRSRGLEDLKPSLLNALEVQDMEVASEQVSKAMQNLQLSERAYEEFYMESAGAVLQEKNLEGITVPSTDFLTDSDLASKSRLQSIIATLKDSENLQEVHGVALLEVVVMPSEKAIESEGTYNLQASDELAFQITLENQGTETETDVPISVKLISPVNPQPQLKTEKVAEIGSKEQQTVRISGINPTEYGEKAELQVEVGPVPNEKLTTNNVLKASVIFTL